MNSRLGCFQQGTCLDIGTQEDNPGLSAALCDSIDHTDRCECCEAEGWPPACSDWRSRCWQHRLRWRRRRRRWLLLFLLLLLLRLLRLRRVQLGCLRLS